MSYFVKGCEKKLILVVLCIFFSVLTQTPHNSADGETTEVIVEESLIAVMGEQTSENDIIIQNINKSESNPDKPTYVVIVPESQPIDSAAEQRSTILIENDQSVRSIQESRDFQLDETDAFDELSESADVDEVYSILLNYPINNEIINTKESIFDFSVSPPDLSDIYCNISIDGISVLEDFEHKAGDITSPIEHSYEGGHDWMVTCYNNSSVMVSLTETYIISTPFNISTNKIQYDSGEEVYIEVGAVDGIVSVDILQPGSDWGYVLSDLLPPFPQNVSFIPVESGIYVINATLNYLAEPIYKSTEIVVSDAPFGVSIEASNDHPNIDEIVTLTITINGINGIIGTANIYLDYGDTVTSYTTTKIIHNLEHTYVSPGEYEINISVTINGKIASATIPLYVSIPDEIAPIVILEAPNNNAILSSDDVNLNYTVSDSSDVSCTLKLSKEDESNIDFFELINEYNDKYANNVSSKRIQINNLDDGKYLWRVKCVDDADNEYTSDGLYFLVATKVTQVVDNTDENLTVVDNLLVEFNKVLNVYDNLPPEKIELLHRVHIYEGLNDHIKKIKQIKRDISNLKFRRDLDDTSRNQIREELIKEAQEASIDVVTDISVVSQKDFVKNTIDNDIKDLIHYYGINENEKITDSQMEALVDYIQNLQQYVSITTNIQHIELTFSSGERKDITLVERNIIGGNSTYNLILEIIPKDVVASADQITFFTDHTVLNEDPVIQFEISKGKILYKLFGKVEFSKIENIDSLLMFDAPYLTQDKGFLTGFAVIESIYETINLKWFLLITIITILLSLYLIHALNLDYQSVTLIFNRKKNSEVRAIQSEISKVRNAINSGDINLAIQLYYNISTRYSGLNPELRYKTYDLLTDVRNDIDAGSLKMEIQEGISMINSSPCEAIKKYELVKNIYAKLSKSNQAKIYLSCAEFNKLLNSIPTQDEAS